MASRTTTITTAQELVAYLRENKARWPLSCSLITYEKRNKGKRKRPDSIYRLKRVLISAYVGFETTYVDAQSCTDTQDDTNLRAYSNEELGYV